MTALIVGGTGPTGVELVRMFSEAGETVTVIHSGAHEVDLGAHVEHLHGDVRREGPLASLIEGRTWDVAVCSYGNLLVQARALKGRVKRLVGITGQPVYRGATAATPTGTLNLPVGEDRPAGGSTDSLPGKIRRGEEELLRLNDDGEVEAVVVRYPGIYGPLAPPGHEWPIVKRVLDHRERMVLPDGGTTYFQRGYAANVAWLVFLAATTAAAPGKVFNAGDEQVMSLRGVVELVCDELGHTPELVDMPGSLCRGLQPLGDKSSIILDMSQARDSLGYRDRVEVGAATRATARWLAEHPVGAGSLAEDRRLHAEIAIDYGREDRLMAAWDAAMATFQSAGADNGG